MGAQERCGSSIFCFEGIAGVVLVHPQ